MEVHTMLNLTELNKTLQDQNKALTIKVLVVVLRLVTHELAMQVALRFNTDLKQAEQNPTVAYGYSVIKMVEEQEQKNVAADSK
jgi:hypothetical protein